MSDIEEAIFDVSIESVATPEVSTEPNPSQTEQSPIQIGSPIISSRRNDATQLMTPPTQIPRRIQQTTSKQMDKNVVQKGKSLPSFRYQFSDSSSNSSSGSKRSMPDLEDAPNSVTFATYAIFLKLINTIIIQLRIEKIKNLNNRNYNERNK